MKSSLFVIASLLFTFATAAASAGPAGQIGSGGGDTCEERFKSIAKDIELWIQAGGPAGLKLNSSVSVLEYSNRMIKEIDTAHVTCVGPGDLGFPVAVDGKAKECKNFVDAKGVSRIVCDRAKFYSGLKNPENDPLQYEIVHHEYASLAKIEKPSDDVSNYTVSDQVTEYLQDTVVKRLALKKRPVDHFCPAEIEFKKSVVKTANAAVETGRSFGLDAVRAENDLRAVQLRCNVITLIQYCKEAPQNAAEVMRDETAAYGVGQVTLNDVIAATDENFRVNERCLGVVTK